jgi:TPR repeat protein
MSLSLLMQIMLLLLINTQWAPLASGDGHSLNLSEAAGLLKMPERQRDPRGQSGYGQWLEHGTSVCVNQAEAARYDKLSADRGEAEGQ